MANLRCPSILGYFSGFVFFHFVLLLFGKGTVPKPCDISFKRGLQPCPVWLSWWCVILQRERSWGRFLVRAQARVWIQPLARACERHLTDRSFCPSLSPYLALSLK